MIELLLAILSSLWLGILTSISPCPLATNIAAISFVAKDVKKQRYTLFSSFLYMAGRVLTYMVISMIIIASLISIPEVSQILQKQMNKILGPILIIVGMFLLELLQFSVRGIDFSKHLKNNIKERGMWGALLLGMLFALSFCPVSAAIFFGGLIPLSIKHNSVLLLPLSYGIGTALPVMFFALLITMGVKTLGKFFNKLTAFDVWARKITGIIFIFIGIYYSLVNIFKLI